MITLDYFKQTVETIDSDGNTQEITQVRNRGVLTTPSVLRELITQGKPQKAIDAHEALCLEWYKWERYDAYMLLMKAWEAEVSLVEKNNELYEEDLEGELELELMELPEEPTFTSFEEATIAMLLPDMYNCTYQVTT